MQTENNLNLNCSQSYPAAHGQAHQHNKLYSFGFKYFMILNENWNSKESDNINYTCCQGKCPFLFYSCCQKSIYHQASKWVDIGHTEHWYEWVCAWTWSWIHINYQSTSQPHHSQVELVPVQGQEQIFNYYRSTADGHISKTDVCHCFRDKLPNENFSVHNLVGLKTNGWTRPYFIYFEKHCTAPALTLYSKHLCCDVVPAGMK